MVKLLSVVLEVGSQNLENVGKEEQFASYVDS